MKIKKILKIILKIVVGIILLISLIQLILPAKRPRDGMVDPKPLFTHLFGQYPSYIYKNHSSKETSFSDYVTVVKAEMNQVALQEKVKYLKENGWRQVYLPYEDQIAFCYGTQNGIMINYPTELHYESGSMFTEDQLKNWRIVYNYNYNDVRDWCGRS